MAPLACRFQSRSARALSPSPSPSSSTTSSPDRRASSRSNTSVAVAGSPRHSRYPSATSSTLTAAESTINSIVLRQRSILGLEEERKSFPRGLTILEPRPLVFWGSLDERMSLHAL
ncbi:hypothetical protein JDV02_001823 [Purpureocillium takamizusanense]|uniref:Uncharacterized protein n=1 Tax=Purpureocillium takamizusanense TaxID=2060973 RepID=A0A9Q8Q7K2_9HYPO|nr:uncharacterized protein JDV02_001823 [Purpureocillium takamizusanense]UNI15279.1 hypothetical protein JDV02_001823 [Purpureocillium takamizusanense]